MSSRPVLVDTMWLPAGAEGRTKMRTRGLEATVQGLDPAPRVRLRDGLVQAPRRRRRRRATTPIFTPSRSVKIDTPGSARASWTWHRDYEGKPRPTDRQTPRRGNNAAVVVYKHGGRWILGNADTQDRLVRELAVGAQAAVAFVDDTPSPEGPASRASPLVRTLFSEVASFTPRPSATGQHQRESSDHEYRRDDPRPAELLLEEQCPDRRPGDDARLAQHGDRGERCPRLRPEHQAVGHD
jgi:acetyl esterase/lipase